jgi:hypothetical protein
MDRTPVALTKRSCSCRAHIAEHILHLRQSAVATKHDTPPRCEPPPLAQSVEHLAEVQSGTGNAQRQVYCPMDFLHT